MNELANLFVSSKRIEMLCTTYRKTPWPRSRLGIGRRLAYIFAVIIRLLTYSLIYYYSLDDSTRLPVTQTLHDSCVIASHFSLVLAVNCVLNEYLYSCRKTK